VTENHIATVKGSLNLQATPTQGALSELFIGSLRITVAFTFRIFLLLLLRGIAIFTLSCLPGLYMLLGGHTK